MKRRRPSPDPSGTAQTPHDPQATPRKRRATDTAVTAVQLPRLPLEMWKEVVFWVKRPREILFCMLTARSHPLACFATRRLGTLCEHRLWERLATDLGVAAKDPGTKEKMQFLIELLVCSMSDHRDAYPSDTRDWARGETPRSIRAMHVCAFVALVLDEVCGWPIPREGCPPYIPKFMLQPSLSRRSCYLWLDNFQIYVFHCPKIRKPCRPPGFLGAPMHLVALGQEPPNNSDRLSVAQTVQTIAGWLRIPYHRGGFWSHALLGGHFGSATRKRAIDDPEPIAVSLLGEAAFKAYP